MQFFLVTRNELAECDGLAKTRSPARFRPAPPHRLQLGDMSEVCAPWCAADPSARCWSRALELCAG